MSSPFLLFPSQHCHIYCIWGSSQFSSFINLLQRNPDTLPSYIACRPAIAHSIVSIIGADHKILRESRMKMRDAELSYANKKEGRREIEKERVCCFTLPFRDTHLAFTRCPGGISMPGFCLHCLCVCQHLGFLLCLLSFFPFPN